MQLYFTLKAIFSLIITLDIGVTLKTLKKGSFLAHNAPKEFPRGQAHLALRALSDPSREARLTVHLEGPHAWALALGWLDALLTEAHMGQLESAEVLWRDVELSAQGAPGDERELCRALLKALGFEQEQIQAPTQAPTEGHDLERWTITQTIHQEARRVRLTFGERCETPAEVCIWSVNSSPLASNTPNAQRQRRVWQVRVTCLLEPNTHKRWRARLIHELLCCGGLQLADSAWASQTTKREGGSERSSGRAPSPSCMCRLSACRWRASYSS